MVLAAGCGTRLRPLTQTIPKCMVPIAGRPLLEHTLLWLSGSGITEIVINLHYLPEVVRSHFADGRKWGVQITYSEEKQLLGTAGAVKKAESLFEGEPFFVWYGDNLSKCDLDSLWEHHKQSRTAATIALHYREDPTQSGMVGLDEVGRITSFTEKPRREDVFSHWVNGGIYVVGSEVLARIPERTVCDFGRDIFPDLLKSGVPLNSYLMTDEEGPWWIDTPADLERSELLFQVPNESRLAKTYYE